MMWLNQVFKQAYTPGCAVYMSLILEQNFVAPLRKFVSHTY